MMLVGEVANRTAIIIDDLADSATTITVSTQEIRFVSHSFFVKLTQRTKDR